MQRRLVVGGAIALLLTAAFLPGSGVGAARNTDGPQFGVAVAMSADGKTVLVGAPGVGSGKGAAYVFHVSNAGHWSSRSTPTATLTSKAGLEFGNAVALSADGTTAFVGAAYVGGPGRVYVFHVAAATAWKSSSKPKATLRAGKADNGVAFTPWTLAASSDGTTLLAGTPFYNDQAGGAYVFHVPGEGAWASTSAPAAILSNADASAQSDGIGFDVAISGDGMTALLGDSQNESGGRADLYRASAENAWTTSSTPTAILSDANASPNAFLGQDVALSADGTVALLGGPNDTGAGFADVFHASGPAAWVSTSIPTAKLTNAGGSNGDGFADDVVLSADGRTALVTAPYQNARRGGAYVFHVADQGAWASTATPAATLTNSRGKAQDYLGWARALSANGATALVGAPGVRWQTGAADVFHVSAASSWASSSAPAAVLANKALFACVVPTLKGLTVPDAKAALKVRSCRLGTVSQVQASGPTGRVVSQSAPPGSRLAVGAKVAVQVAR